MHKVHHGTLSGFTQAIRRESAKRPIMFSFHVFQNKEETEIGFTGIFAVGFKESSHTVTFEERHAKEGQSDEDLIEKQKMFSTSMLAIKNYLESLGQSVYAGAIDEPVVARMDVPEVLDLMREYAEKQAGAVINQEATEVEELEVHK